MDQSAKDALIREQQATSGVFSPLQCNSHRSHTSSASSRAKAAAAKARLQYAIKEAELRKEHSLLEEKRIVAEAAAAREKKDLEIKLNLLKEEQNAAELQAEADALENSDDERNSQSSHVPDEQKVQRVLDFVNMSADMHTDHIQHAKPPVSDNVNQMQDITRFLLKKDMTLSRLVQFSDKPENYQAWKGTFDNVVKDMDLSASETLDLLIKWLGTESRKHAISLKSSCVDNAEKAVKLLWQRLDERYGSVESVFSALTAKLQAFPKITQKDSSKLYDLSDILVEIQTFKENGAYKVALSYFDSSVGITPILGKLPNFMLEKWVTIASNYKESHGLAHPPFSLLVDFIQKQARIRNDPSFQFPAEPRQSAMKTSGRMEPFRTVVHSRKTDVERTSESANCALHQGKPHSLGQCRQFKAKSFTEKRTLLKKEGLCFKCFGRTHQSKDCKENVKCEECGKSHNTAMHIDSRHGGEKTVPTETVNNLCTQVCGSTKFPGKSCAKIVPVFIYDKANKDNKVRTYAIIDDQSNRTLVSPSLLDSLNPEDCEMIEYSVNSCNGTKVTCGRKVSSLMVSNLVGDTELELPPVLECKNIPNNRNEIPTPEIAACYDHLNSIECEIPQVNNDTDIQILIGRDLIEAHIVHDQRIGPKNTPYAQKLALGWVIVGEACLGSRYKVDNLTLTVNKTCIYSEGRSTVLSPCTNSFLCEEEYNPISQECEIFKKTKDDDKPGLSVEDREFISLMNENFVCGPSGNWTAPLPFKSDRPRLPNNKIVAERRAKLLDVSLRKNPAKQQHFVEFMSKILENGHAEVAPDLKPNEECWYLPIFGVYHPKKVDQIRVVFDSSANYQDLSLNDVLMSGPDLTNNLLGVLLRFRKEPIAVTADIQQMFYCFHVNGEHRNFLRFLWYQDNDLNKKLIEYRMKVHVFGNRPSPAVAAYGLRKTALISSSEFGLDVTDFIMNNFYVDDGLTSVPTEEQAVALIVNTQSALMKNGNLRLHKIASNSMNVLNALPREDLARNLTDIDLSCSEIPLQHSLGLSWNIQNDTFTFQVSENVKPFTRRGILSTINSVYDPVGFVAPVVITGKLLLQDLVSTNQDWDDPLPEDKFIMWQDWWSSLSSLNLLEIPRHCTQSSGEATKELHVYCDASERVIAAAAYIVSFHHGSKQASFVLGKTKVAPRNGHTIPRLELCAAVLGIEVACTVLTNIDIDFTQVKYYSDSKVVLGYIGNRTRRFYTYVSNRVQKILSHSSPEQWFYVPTHLNPADIGTRGVSATDLAQSAWLRGPTISEENCKQHSSFELLDPDQDPEIRVKALATNIEVKRSLDSKRFSKFSDWSRLKRAIACLQHIAESYHTNRCKGWHICSETDYKKAEALILQTVQKEAYADEYTSLCNKKPVSKGSSIASLNPFVDDDGILRVGGRLQRSSLTNREMHPAIIPRKCHVASLLVHHYHKNVKHQGRHFTEGAVRAQGYWIIGAKRLISSVIHNCVQCRKLRGRHAEQIMADLPKDRVEPAPPFTYVGVDTFGPWNIVTRKTRGGQASSKRWAILFTCLTIRAIHIEVVPEMSSSAFTNALRRFIARYGNVKLFRSDRGTNFVGTVNELGMDAVNVEDGEVHGLLKNNDVTWVFNPPHASHMGGVWERMIGTVKRILNSMLCETSRDLTDDVLVTLMAEVCSIVNARPIVPVATDSSVPEILSPSSILTRKVDFETKEFEHLTLKDIYKSEWRRVQVLANQFWQRWRSEYLQTLQARSKWQREHCNIKINDIVLVRDSVPRNRWPYGIVENVFPNEDGKVRKVCIRMYNEGKLTVLTRPISELVLLVESD